MRYRAAAAFRDALVHRLNVQATARRIAVNVLRKQVAIDRFLAGLTVAAPAGWIVKGAYAIDLHHGARGRAGRDVDLARRDDSAAALRDLRDTSAVDVGDFFRFAMERSPRSLQRDHDRASRSRDAADRAGRRFATLTVAVALGERLASTPDRIEGPGILAFAGIALTRLPATPLELQMPRRFTPTRACIHRVDAILASRTSSICADRAHGGGAEPGAGVGPAPDVCGAPHPRPAPRTAAASRVGGAVPRARDDGRPSP